ncbi:MAG: hypothetical protein ACYCZM_11985 [Acidimicrobiales bacterium]
MHPLADVFLAVTGTAVLGASVVVGVFVIGGLFHILIRTGRDGQRLNQIEADLRSLRDDVRELFRNVSGRDSPSVRRERRENGGSGVDSTPHGE